jgi:hypothetical protein
VPGFLVHAGATVICAHGGQATPTSPDPRVKVGGQPIVTQPEPYTVAGCAFVPPSGNGPCATAQWLVAATRVRAGGKPVVIASSTSLCTPTGTPLTIAVTQMRAKAT